MLERIGIIVKHLQKKTLIYVNVIIFELFS